MATAWLFQRTKGKGQAWSVGWRDHDKKKREKKIGFLKRSQTVKDPCRYKARKQALNDQDDFVANLWRELIIKVGW